MVNIAKFELGLTEVKILKKSVEISLPCGTPVLNRVIGVKWITMSDLENAVS